MRLIMYYPLNVGRNMDEDIALLEGAARRWMSMGWQPLDWQSGDEVVLARALGVESALWAAQEGVVDFYLVRRAVKVVSLG